MTSDYQFIGPLKPGQKPPPPPSIADRMDNWTIFDILTLHSDTASSSGQLAIGDGSARAIGKVKKPKKFIRAAGGTVWEDPSLADWDPNDYRVFCGDLGNDVTDELLKATFEKYPSFVRARVVRDKRTSKSKGYGFISFKDQQDYVRAIKEWDGKYLGCRPIKLRKSAWRDRGIDVKRSKMPGVVLEPQQSQQAQQPHQPQSTQQQQQQQPPPTAQ